MESQGCIYKTVEAAQGSTLGLSQRIAFRSQADLLGSLEMSLFQAWPRSFLQVAPERNNP